VQFEMNADDEFVGVLVSATWWTCCAASSIGVVDA
jgi:hypothetical protein